MDDGKGVAVTIMKIAIDAMGGDHAPKEIVLGAVKAIQSFPDLKIVLVGDETKIKEYLQKIQIELKLYIQKK